MKYLPEDLRREYDYYTKACPDLEGLEHPLINMSDTLRAYFILVHYFSDDSGDEAVEKMLVGIRSTDLIASALSRQVTQFEGKIKYTEPLHICATLFYGMVKNHSFNDGNKRTALLVLLYQLQLYGYYPTKPKKEFEKLVVSVANNSIDEDYKRYYKKFKKLDDNTDKIVRTISSVLKRLVAKKDNSYHICPTMKDFCDALSNYDVTCTQDNGKMKFVYHTPGEWKDVETKEQSFSIPFGGWTRTVGPKTARDTLRALGLYDHFASYKDIFRGSDPLYSLVDNFKEPLRRLKDM